MILNQFSNFLQNALLNTAFCNVAYVPSSGVFIALFQALPLANGSGGTELTGTTASGYARQLVSFDTPSGGIISNSGTVNFPISTSIWPTVSGACIFDAATGGHLMAIGPLTSPVSLPASKILSFPEGNFVIQIV